MRIALVTISLLLVACSPQTPTRTGTVPDLDGHFDFATLEVVNDAGKTLTFDVYLAKNFDQQRRGLMFVRDMPETTGMLFIYEQVDIRSIWMKNTYIPLDIVFARDDGTVIHIVGDATPQTLNSTTRRMAIGTNSRLLWNSDEQ